jgi:hypothetical protein
MRKAGVWQIVSIDPASQTRIVCGLAEFNPPQALGSAAGLYWQKRRDEVAP